MPRKAGSGKNKESRKHKDKHKEGGRKGKGQLYPGFVIGHYTVTT